MGTTVWDKSDDHENNSMALYYTLEGLIHSKDEFVIRCSNANIYRFDSGYNISSGYARTIINGHDATLSYHQEFDEYYIEVEKVTISIETSIIERIEVL